MKTLRNFLKFNSGSECTQEFYLQMRSDYINSKFQQINLVSKLNSFYHPKYKIESSKGLLGELNNDSVNDICQQIKNNGYYVFDSKLSSEKVTDLKNFAQNTPINYLMIDANNKAKFSEAKITYKESKNKSNRHQFTNISAFKGNQNINEIISDFNFLHIANNYLNTKPILDLVTMWWSNSLNRIENEKKEMLKNSAAQMFHFDMDRLKFLKFFIYLTDVDSNTGPHVYVKKSNKVLPKYITADGRYSDNLIYKNDGSNVVEINGKAGNDDTFFT